ncbi:sulfite exporter TauE/SafE family protein [Saccharopolyspora sp. K220]|uniref:sulfite exporter TauE/SafE family protein n=1 Tax=Saccharopolyspora soli TaxID=2926618 RepID=UPI001F5A2DD5|nr:sulfite exporter TauE/SafE family protein [Saccharopolyspora soli]MCI2421714.1 sulfite exporter TauE/SafE family protein [Saccharopolyspora soli]
MLGTVALLLAGVAGGALNAVGGGGTFVVLPALVVAGLPPVAANASTTVALLPGALTSAWAYRRDVVQVGSTATLPLTVSSLLGSVVGAGLLLVLPAASFDAAVPWLLAFATVVLAFGRKITRMLNAALGRPFDLSTSAVLIGQFLLAIYGGYFGGAVGILMLAFWSIGVGLDAAAGNPTRVVQLAAIYTVAAVFFLIAADVLSYAVPVAAVLVGAIIGGWGGAQVARRLPSAALRGVVLTTAVTMTVVYFLRA